MKFQDRARLIPADISPVPAVATGPRDAPLLTSPYSLSTCLPPAHSIISSAPWRPDELLFPSGPIRANVVAIGGFRECGPYHFQTVGEDLRQRGCLVRLASLFDHQDGHVVSRTFTPRNIMNKAVHDVQVTLQHAPDAPLILIGFSAGGLAAFQLAQRFSFHPIAAVVVEGLFAGSDSAIRRAYPLLLRLKQKYFTAARWENETSRTLSYKPSFVPATFRTDAWDARPRVPGVTVGSLLALDDFRRETLALIERTQFDCPIYFAHGGHDRSSSFKAAQSVFDHISEKGGSAELLHMPHSAHSIALGREAATYREWITGLVESSLTRSSTMRR